MCPVKAKNILCIERNGHVDNKYYEALDLLIAASDKFDNIIRLSTDFRIMKLSEFSEYYNNVKYYKSIGMILQLELRKILVDNITDVWAPTTSMLWSFVATRNVKVHLLEHGLGEYIQARDLSSHRASLKSAIRTIIDAIFGFQLLTSPAKYDTIHLCSNAVPVQTSSKVVQIDCAKHFHDYSGRFWANYIAAYQPETSEFIDITRSIDVANAYLYLPSTEIKFEYYDSFIQKQMGFLDLPKDVYFILKNHPGNREFDYNKLLSAYGDVIEIKDVRNSYLPAEFIANELHIGHVLGSFSSALYYIKSWMPEIRTHFYNNYSTLLLRDDCKGFSDLMGLQ